MPTQNPRLTITLEPTLAAQLRRISELTGNSQSKLISEMLEGSTQVFARLIQVLEAAEQAKGALKGKTAQDIGDAQARIEKQLGLVFEEFDTLTLPLLKEAESITRRARKRTGGAPLAGMHPGAAAPSPALVTPPSNRGGQVYRQPEKDEGKNRSWPWSGLMPIRPPPRRRKPRT